MLNRIDSNDLRLIVMSIPLFYRICHLFIYLIMNYMMPRFPTPFGLGMIVAAFINQILGLIILNPCNSIHTFFMKFNIDVLFLDEQMQVIKKIENLRPGKVVTVVRGAKIVIESKEGTFNNIKEGNIMSI